MNPDGSMSANCSCTLLSYHPNKVDTLGNRDNSERRSNKVIVDTLSPWDRETLVGLLSAENVQVEDITHVICTHGHPDHTGNNNLFTSAKLHIVGHSIYHRDTYLEHEFSKGKSYQLDGKDLVVAPTPGHTLDSVCVLVNTREGRVCLAGDLFEKVEDIEDTSIWKEAGSESEICQITNRSKVLFNSDFIVPGHGPMFRVTNAMKLSAQTSMKNISVNTFGFQTI